MEVVGLYGCQKGFKIVHEIKFQGMFFFVVFEFQFAVVRVRYSTICGVCCIQLATWESRTRCDEKTLRQLGQTKLTASCLVSVFEKVCKMFDPYIVRGMSFMQE